MKLSILSVPEEEYMEVHESVVGKNFKDSMVRSRGQWVRRAEKRDKKM